VHAHGFFVHTLARSSVRHAGVALSQHFKSGHGINVPRSRFLPVKGTSDLLLVQSDLYSLTHGQLLMNPARPFPSVPLIKLGKEFSKVGDYLARFQSIPTILELDHLTITGDVTIGSGVTFKVRRAWPHTCFGVLLLLLVCVR
jgi:UTP--glucose-1-phosphate uridylyltransferase